MPSVSVIVPTCDRPDMLVEALASVWAQSRRADEVIVVDNGTTPVADSLAQRFPGIRIERIPPRSGASFARNWGAWRAEGELLAFLDDDDLWPAEYLTHMIACQQERSSALVAAPQRLSDTLKETERPIVPDARGIFPRWARIGYRGSNVLIRRDAFWSVHGFATRLVTGEDRALAIELAAARYRLDICTGTYALKREHAGTQLTDRATLAIGKLCFLNAFADRMPPADIREDRLAIVVNLSRLWGWPLWLVGAAMAPRAAFRRLSKYLPKRTAMPDEDPPSG